MSKEFARKADSASFVDAAENLIKVMNKNCFGCEIGERLEGDSHKNNCGEAPDHCRYGGEVGEALRLFKKAMESHASEVKAAVEAFRKRVEKHLDGFWLGDSLAGSIRRLKKEIRALHAQEKGDGDGV